MTPPEGEGRSFALATRFRLVPQTPPPCGGRVPLLQTHAFALDCSHTFLFHTVDTCFCPVRAGGESADKKAGRVRAPGLVPWPAEQFPPAAAPRGLHEGGHGPGATRRPVRPAQQTQLLCPGCWPLAAPILRLDELTSFENRADVTRVSICHPVFCIF